MKYLVGVDCATDPKKVGVALAEMSDRVLVCDVHAGKRDPWATVTGWLEDCGEQDVLIAIDAPLGWPIALGRELHGHYAGRLIDRCPNEMFRRYTDRQIKDLTGKQPLDVGADRIARTAHAALKGLDILRGKSGNQIPLAWSVDKFKGIQAIEVYPAATLKSHRLPCEKYKKPGDNHRRVREEIASKLRDSKHFRFASRSWESVLDNADGLDAVICLLAAADFLRDDSRRPPQDAREIVRHEGWIWCYEP